MICHVSIVVVAAATVVWFEYSAYFLSLGVQMHFSSILFLIFSRYLSLKR